MTSNLMGTPPTLLHNLEHNQVLHERVVLLTVVTSDAPHVDRRRAPQRGDARAGLLSRDAALRVHGGAGRAGGAGESAPRRDCRSVAEKTTFFLGIETLLPTNRPGMALWRERLFALMSRNAVRATSFFRIPPERVVEMGMQIEL